MWVTAGERMGQHIWLFLFICVPTSVKQKGVCWDSGESNLVVQVKQVRVVLSNVSLRVRDQLSYIPGRPTQRQLVKAETRLHYIHLQLHT